MNEWSRDRSFIAEFALGDAGGGIVPVFISDTAPDSQESDIEPVPIPQLSVRYQWLIVTGGYYSKTEFDFEPRFVTTQLVDSAGNPGDTIRLSRFETLGERYEWDASGGIYVHPYVAILGGYKKVRQTINETFRTTDLFGTSPVGRSVSNIDIEGPTIGIAAAVPIGGGFGMYGSYAHGFMDTKIRTVADSDFDSGTSPDFDTSYNVAELGFTYTHGVEGLMPHMPLSAATVYAGYRYQRISTDFSEFGLQDAGDVTEGFAVGVNFSF